MFVTLDASPGSEEAFNTVDRLRERLGAITGADAIVGGEDATELDVAQANARDRMVVMPLVLVVVLVILLSVVVHGVSVSPIMRRVDP